MDEHSDIYQAGRRIANAITPGNAIGSTDESGGHVESLTEAVMGVTKALMAIAAGLQSIAEAIEENNGAQAVADILEESSDVAHNGARTLRITGDVDTYPQE